MFMDKPHVVMAQALTDATLLHIGKQDLLRGDVGRSGVLPQDHRRLLPSACTC